MNKKILLLCSILSFLKMSQADIELSEYSHSGLTCKAIVIPSDFLNKYDEIETVYQERLKKVLELIDFSKKQIDLTQQANILENAAEEVNMLMGLFSIKDNQLLEDIYLNIQMRAALMGNSTAIYEIFDIPFPIRPDSISNNFLLNGKTMTIKQFFLISEKFNEKYEERSKENLLCEVLEEL